MATGMFISGGNVLDCYTCTVNIVDKKIIACNHYSADALQDLVNPKYYKYFYQVNVNTGGEYVINFNNFAIQSLHVNLNYLNNSDFDKLYCDSHDIAKMLNALVGKLNEKKYKDKSYLY